MNRLGFTIAEVVVAVLILSLGLLSLVGTAALATRMVAQGQRHTRASVLGAQQLAILTSGGCPQEGSGAAVHGGFRIAWSVSSEAGGRMRRAHVVVASRTHGGMRLDTFSTAVLCRGRG
ncbi:MAG: hypothetical protein GTN62_08110 [Gemmatimonadales bacterium]|nr:hypothetical protein [Gemmatimonadales bacterium]NIN11456.1 hypothetical protein [Gemmatimonadales bacterium]NIN50065.1 hypothetical protein [Gemmatimonadales bacterium]NIP07529.1 hypothetical protein [Gemmatimonadales bacterium]NIR03171.1 hypothetical protein [Gemmatimonadales bacterium]